MAQQLRYELVSYGPGPKSLAVHAGESDLYIKGSPARETLLPICFVSGHGEYLVDADGKEYLDFSAGLAVPCGHTFEPVVEATQAACAQLEACEDYTNRYRSQLTGMLAQIFPGNLGGVQYYSSGTEAVEAALRFMRAASGNDEFIAFYGSYHGKTSGSVSLAQMSDYNGPRATGFYRAPYAFCYRCVYSKHYPGCSLHCVDQLKKIVEQQTRGRLAGIVVEPVQGFAGAIIPPPGYLQGLQDICREFGALLMVDEILTGLGRTGSLFAFEQFGITPDVVTIGKGLGNGVPITAVLIEGRYRDKVRHIEGGTTYGGNPISCAAAVTTISELLNRRLPERGRTLGRIILQRLQSMMEEHECIGDVRALGCLAAIEFVKARSTKEPDPMMAKCVYRIACRYGVLTTPIEHVLRLTPPLTISETLVDEAMDKLKLAIAEACALSSRVA